MFRNHSVKHGIKGNMPHNLDTYISEITLGNDFESDVDIPEHKHECQGVHWPAVFPSEIALAGRVLIKSLAERSSPVDIDNFKDMLVYSQLLFTYWLFSPVDVMVNMTLLLIAFIIFYRTFLKIIHKSIQKANWSYIYTRLYCYIAFNILQALNLY